MPTQKFCNVGDCKEFIFATLDDFGEHGWTAFQCPAGNGKVVCYCPKHQKECMRDMEKVLLLYNKRKKEVKPNSSHA